MNDYRESQMRSYAQHRTAHGDAKASHEAPKPKPEADWITQECDDCRLTELGARVLKILRDVYPVNANQWPGPKHVRPDTEAALSVLAAARDLGLLEEGGT